MDFLIILSKRSKRFYIILISLSLLTSFFSLIMLTLINNAITDVSIPFFEDYDWLIFTSLIIASFVLHHTFQVYLIDLTANFNYEFEVYLLDKLEKAKLEELEKLGIDKIFSATGDIRQLSQLPEILIDTIQSVIIILGCFLYLFWSSFVAGIITLVLMATMFVFYIVRNSRIEKDLQIARSLENDYLRYLNDLLYGFKEVKTSKKKNKNIHHNFLKRNRENRIAIVKKSTTKYARNELLGNYSWYVVLGFILFLLPRLLNLDISNLSVFLVTIIYMMGPIIALIGLIPSLTNIKIAVSRLNEFRTHIEGKFEESTTNGHDKALPTFNRFNIRGLEYSYLNDWGEKIFSLGPINMNIDKGEILFIQGGNGSGKSTFVKLISGLYEPQSGEIELLGDSNQNGSFNLCDYVSIVFTNPYMFSENYEDYILGSGNDQLKRYVNLFKMENKLQLDTSSNVLTQKLSKGQEKRLAFILALLEEKPVLILDEWAAEQDPEFRSYFYQTILPTLKEEGKTIIAVTHDDAYFHCADKTIKFDCGKITE